MYTLFSWCSDCRADTEFELVADTLVAEERAAEYACQECGAAIMVPRVTAQWALRAEFLPGGHASRSSRVA